MRIHMAIIAMAFSLAGLGSAQAGLIGSTVHGTLAFGSNGGNGGQYWGPQDSVITDPGIEYTYVDGANTDTAEFTDTQLIITDLTSSGANGFEMTFRLISGGSFTGISKISDSFTSALTYNLVGDLITIDYLGDNSFTTNPAVAVFNITTTAVPEPLTLSLFGAGLAGAVAARRRKKAVQA